MSVDVGRSDAEMEAAVRPLLSSSGAGIRGALLRLAWPIVTERLSLTLLTVVDALLVARYVGADGLAAIGLSTLFLWLSLAGTFGAQTGAATVVAWDVGGGSTAEAGTGQVAAERSIQGAVAAAFVWGVVAALPLAALTPWLLALAGADAEVAALGARYLRVAVVALPFLLVTYAAAGAFHGMGNAVRPMLVLLGVNVVNLLVTFLLISGVAGVRLGVLASGIGYAAGGVVGGVASLALLAHGYGGVRYRLAGAARPGWEPLRRFLKVAAPVTLEELQFTAAFLLYTRIVAAGGTAAVAAHTIALRTLEAAIVPGFALGAAATTLVGQALGMGRADLAEQTARTARRFSLVVTLALGGALALCAPVVAGWFVEDAEVRRTAATLLRIFSLALPVIGLSAALAGALRGAGDVRYVLGVTSATTWLVRIPTAWVCAIVLGFGAPGAWVGAVVENSVRGALVLARFRSGRWKRFRV